MKVGGILGLIGGLIALIIGAVGYGLFGLGNDASSLFNSGTSALDSLVGAGGELKGAVGTAGSYQVYQFFGIVLPIVGIIGAAISGSRPSQGALAMAVAAVGLLIVFGFGVFSIVSIVLLGLGAILTFSGSKNAT